MNTLKKGSEVSFRNARGLTRTARVGTALYDKFENGTKYKRTIKSPKELDKAFGEKIDLTKIDQVGAKTAEKLITAGYMTVKAVAESTAQEVSEKADISLNSATKAVEGAKAKIAEVPSE